MKRMSVVLIASALALPLAGCMETMPRPDRPGRPGPSPATRYVCDNGQALIVDYRPGVAIVQTGGSRFRLRQQPAGSGISYGDARHSLRGRGSDVTWTVGRMVPIQCRAAGWPPR